MAVNVKKNKQYQVKKDVGYQKNMNGSLKESQASLATGGGQPIPKGHKRTSEHRVLQPRDAEGHFDYNSSANISRKYDYHAERNGSHGGEGGGGKYKTLPSFARNLQISEKFAKFGVEKGDIISANGQKYISTCPLTKDQFVEQLENYLEDEKGGTHLGNDVNWMKYGGPDDKKFKGKKGEQKNVENNAAMLDKFENAVWQRTKAYADDPHGEKLSPKFAAMAPDLGDEEQAENAKKNEVFDNKKAAAAAAVDNNKKEEAHNKLYDLLRPKKDVDKLNAHKMGGDNEEFNEKDAVAKAIGDLGLDLDFGADKDVIDRAGKGIADLFANIGKKK